MSVNQYTDGKRISGPTCYAVIVKDMIENGLNMPCNGKYEHKRKIARKEHALFRICS